VKSACVDQLTPAENQSRGLRPAQSFSTAEDTRSAALLREVPEVLDRRELGRGVDDDRDMGFMRIAMTASRGVRPCARAGFPAK